jgi:hypothetical protein
VHSAFRTSACRFRIHRDAMETSTSTGADSHVSEQIFEFLVTELTHYSRAHCAPASDSQRDEEEALAMASEMVQAKVERMGYSVGYRITERLALNKTWNVAPNQDTAVAVASQQLEAVKFLCKDVWLELFAKQIDKLQTNHRGVFVLKDLSLKWMLRFPVGAEDSRIMAQQLLSYPCGIIRGCLSNLGIPAVVSCDFLADGQSMAACSFNIKVK